MNLTLSVPDLINYTSSQLDHFFPDRYPATLRDHRPAIDTAISRMDVCFKPVRSTRYSEESATKFNHLYSDHYIVYLWFLANSLCEDGANENLLNKLYYLNKALHGFDCMFNTSLPDHFLIIHGSGTVLGKADYGDFFVAHHGCTVGIHNNLYPVIGCGAALAANSAVIGGSVLGENVSVGNGAHVFNSVVPAGHSVYRQRDGQLASSPSKQFYSDFYFIR
jgi:serine O-acetyltransferase